MLSDEFVFCIQFRKSNSVEEDFFWIVGIDGKDNIALNDEANFENETDARNHAKSLCNQYGRHKYIFKRMYQIFPSSIRI